MAKMNPEIKAKWVAALRSGDYVQGKTCLRTAESKFCCLGVLTDLAIKDGLGEWSMAETTFTYGNDISLLPSAVSEWAGFGYPARMGGEVEIDGVVDMLAGHNDCGVAFAQIADAIEAQL